MRKSTIVTILLIYLASIVAVGFLGTRVRVYNEIRLVSSVEVNIQAANANSYIPSEDPPIVDEKTGYKIYKVTVLYTKYKENGVLELAFMPVFTFKDGTKEEMMGTSVSYQITPEGYVSSGAVEITENGVLTIKKKRSIYIYITPISTDKISAMTDSTIILDLDVR